MGSRNKPYVTDQSGTTLKVTFPIQSSCPRPGTSTVCASSTNDTTSLRWRSGWAKTTFYIKKNGILCISYTAKHKSTHCYKTVEVYFTKVRCRCHVLLCKCSISKSVYEHAHINHTKSNANTIHCNLVWKD